MGERGPKWCQNLAVAGAVKRGERVLIQVDPPMARSGEQLAAALGGLGAEARLAIVGVDSSDEAWAPTLEELRRTDVVFGMFSRPPRFTPASLERQRALLGSGGRALAVPFASAELLEGELSRPQANLERELRALLGQVEGSRRVHVRGRAGTDLTVSVAGRQWHGDGLPLGPGMSGNFPSGEVFVAPLGDAQGTIVADVSIPFVCDGFVSEPVRLTVEAGRVVDIQGGSEARRLAEFLREAGGRSDEIAEVGIGVNAFARPIGHVIVDEKVAGTAHVAVGRNVHFGGDIDAPIHVDFVFDDPTITVDGRTVHVDALR